MEIEITEMPELRIGAVRSDMAHIAEAQGRLWGIVGPSGLAATPGVIGVSVMPSTVTQGPTDDMRYDAAVIVPDTLELPDGLIEDRVPAGRYARATYVGPYEGLGGAWGELTGEWLPASGHRIADGVCYEIYRNSPAEVPETELRTELYIPLA